MLFSGRLLLSDFRCHAATLLGCELLFRALAAVLLGPMVTWIVVQLIGLSGRAAISNVEIVDYLLTPLGWLTIVIFIGLELTIEYVSQSALLVVQLGQRAGRSPGLWQALLAVSRRSTVILELALVLVGVLFVVALPFALTGLLIYRGLLGEFDVNYYLSQKPTEFLVAVALGVALAVALLIVWAMIYARTLLAVPACVLTGRRPVAALRHSCELTRNHHWTIVKWLSLWFAITSLAGLLLAVVVQFVEAMSLRAASQSLSAVAVVVGLLLTLNFVAGAVTTMFGHLSLSLIIGRLYWSLQRAASVDPPASGMVVEQSGGIAWTVDAEAEREAGGSGTLVTRNRALAGLLLATLCSLGFSSLLLRSVSDQDTVRVTAHRGSSRAAPENTLAAIQQAIDDGADDAEIDVQETLDGAVIVMHDADLMRIAGDRRKIWETSLAELQSVDAGSWFDKAFAAQRVPTLQQAIEIARGKIGLNIELKFNGHDRDLVGRTLSVVRESGFGAECVISSLDHSAFQRVRAIDPRIPVGAIVGVSIGDVSRLQADFISINVAHVNRQLIRKLHRQGKQIHVWTVNDEKTMSDMIELGVDSILTDEPQRLVQLLKARQELNAGERLLLAFRKLLAY